MDVDKLRTLVELSRRGTMAAVAEATGYGTSAVSQQLAALERQAKVPLLEASGRGRPAHPGGPAPGRARRADPGGADRGRDRPQRRGRAERAGPGGGLHQRASAPSAAGAGRARARRTRGWSCRSRSGSRPRSTRCSTTTSSTWASSTTTRSSRAAAGASARCCPASRCGCSCIRIWLCQRRFGRRSGLSQFRDVEWIGNSRDSADTELAVRICALAGWEPRMQHNADSLDLAVDLALATRGGCAPGR